MLAELVGNLGGNGALVLVVLIISSCSVVLALLLRPPREDKMQTFELQKRKLVNEREIGAQSAAYAHDEKMAQIQQNLITSHRVEEAKK